MSLADPLIQPLRRLAYGYYRLRLRAHSSQYLFIVGHMRSGSSLLVHLLNSNPGISGYGETHITYESPADFERLACNVKFTLRQLRFNEQWIMDKVLHDRHTPDFNLLIKAKAKFLFLLRDPAETLKSMVKLWGETGNDLIRMHSRQEYAQYFENRLNTLARYAERIGDPQRSVFVTYDQLLNETQSAFNAIQDCFGLRDPLKEQYSKLSTTGKEGVGNSSEAIHSGGLVRSAPRKPVQLEPELLKPVEAAYEACQTSLMRHCRSIRRSNGVA